MATISVASLAWADMSTTLVFVHGAFHGPWCWEKVVACLEALGTPSVSLELYRGSLENDIAHVQAQVDRLGAEGERVVLVGHSMGGIAISGVDPKTVAHLVYVAALLQGRGMPSPIDGVVPNFNESLHFEDGVMTIDPKHAEALFYHDCSVEDVKWAIPQLRPYRVYAGDDDDSNPSWRQIPSTYLVCTEDRSISVDYQRKAAALVAYSEEFSASHSPMIPVPALVVEALQRVIARVG